MQTMQDMEMNYATITWCSWTKYWAHRQHFAAYFIVCVFETQKKLVKRRSLLVAACGKQMKTNKNKSKNNNPRESRWWKLKMGKNNNADWTRADIFQFTRARQGGRPCWQNLQMHFKSDLIIYVTNSVAQLALKLGVNRNGFEANNSRWLYSFEAKCHSFSGW